MMGRIIPFPVGRPRKPSAPALTSLPAPFTAHWQDEHLPLIDAAMNLLQADDAEFARRCQEIASNEGPAWLEALSTQLDRLGSHVGDVVEALTTTAMRIRIVMADQEGCPA